MRLRPFAKRLARELSPHVPQLGRAPYAAALRAVRAAVALPGLGSPLVWPRHSYVTGAFKPLISDLDLTLWYERTPSRGEVDRLNRLLAKLRLASPMLGEINSYTAEEAHRYAACLNRFELDRDPELASRLAEDQLNPASLRLQGGVFLLRMIDADVRNLIECPALRIAKWEEHLRAVEEGTGVSLHGALQNVPEDFLLSLLIRLAVDVLGLGSREDEIVATEALEKYYRHVGAGRRLEALESSAWGWALLPHRFRFSGDRAPPPLSALQFAIFEQQVGWEIWGLMSQYRNPSDRAGFVSHLEALASTTALLGKGSPDSGILENLRRLGTAVSDW